MSSPADEQETQIMSIHGEQTSESPLAHSDDLFQPPPSAQPGQDDLDYRASMNDEPEKVATDGHEHDSNATACVEETQFVDLELDSQAPEDPSSPLTKKTVEEGNQQSRETPALLSQPVFVSENVDPAGQPRFIERPAAETIDDMTSGFKFGAVAKPMEISYSKPPTNDPNKGRPVQSSAVGSAAHMDSSHQLAEKVSVTAETRNSLPSRGVRSRSIVDMTIDPQVSTNAPTSVVVHQNAAARPTGTQDFTPKITSSKRSGSKSQQSNAQASTMPHNDASIHAYATPQSIPGPRARVLVPQKQRIVQQILTPPLYKNSTPTPIAGTTRSSRPAALPFADVAREKTEYISVKNSLVLVQNRGNADRRKENREKYGMGQGNQTDSSYHPRQQQHLGPNIEIHRDPQHEADTVYDGNLAQLGMWNDENPRTDRSRQAHPRAPIEEASGSNGHYYDQDLPDTQFQGPQPLLSHSKDRQLPSKQMTNRPLTAAQLQPQGAPQSMSGNSRGLMKVSKSRPQSRTPEISSRNIGQPSQLKASPNPTSADILQMAMFMVHNEQEQSQAAELQIRDQQSKIDHLMDENLVLHREVGSVQGEKNKLGIELVRLKEKSEGYKTHINEVTRSQKHLEKLILKSNEKQELLLKEIENREDVARKQVKEAGDQIQSYRSGLAERVEEGVKNARHQIELLKQSHQQIKKELEEKALLLLREQGQRDKLEKKLEKLQPDQEALLQKLQEHFENVAKQLSGHEGKLSSFVSCEETSKSKFDECLTILNTIKNKEAPEPPALGELVKMIETMSTRIENHLILDGEAKTNLREEGRGHLDDLKDRIEAIRTDQKAQEALYDRISNLREVNAGLTEKIQAIELELSNLKNEHASLKGEYDRCKSQLTATKGELSRVAALPREDPAIQSQIQELQTKNASLLNQVDTISKEVASIKEQLILEQNKSKASQEQSDTLRDKLHEAENLVSNFNEQRLKYEHAKTQESIKLRKEFEETLTEKFKEKTLTHENTERSLKRAKSAAEKKLSEVLVNLEESNSSGVTAASTISQLRADLKTAESCKKEQTAEIDRLEGDLGSVTERYDCVSNELQSARAEILQCRQLIAESENQTAQSSELVQKVQDEATQRLKDIEEYAESEIGKLKEQIISSQEKLAKSESRERAYGRYLLSRGLVKDGQDLQQWMQANTREAQENQETRATEPAPRPSSRHVSFQITPSIQNQPPNAEQSSSSKNMPQGSFSTQSQSSRSSRPRIATRKSSISQVNSPSHMKELENFMQRTEVTEFSVRTSKTYENHRNQNTIISEVSNDRHRPRSSSPMTDLEPVLANKKALETGLGIEKALKKQRSMKRSPQDINETRVRIKTVPLTAEEEKSRRRQEQTPKSAMKRPRATPTPLNSTQKVASEGNGGKGLMPPVIQRDNQQIHAFGTSPYNRIVSGSDASRQQPGAAGNSHNNSNLGRELSRGVVTKSGENGDVHPAKIRRTMTMSKKVIPPDSQSESQISLYTPSQEV